MSRIGRRVRSLSFNLGWPKHIREIVVIAGAYFFYMLVRRFMIPNLESVAFENAVKVTSLESAWGFFLEPKWQSWLIENSKSPSHISKLGIYRHVCSHNFGNGRFGVHERLAEIHLLSKRDTNELRIRAVAFCFLSSGSTALLTGARVCGHAPMGRRTHLMVRWHRHGRGHLLQRIRRHAEPAFRVVSPIWRPVFQNGAGLAKNLRNTLSDNNLIRHHLDGKSLHR